MPSKRRVWKYDVPYSCHRFSVSMPEKADVLTARAMGCGVAMWALVDPELPLEQRHFKLVETGEESDVLHPLGFVDMFVVNKLVYHLFEIETDSIATYSGILRAVEGPDADQE